jgi:hypothetical protein
MAIYDPAQSHDQNFKNLFVENPWAAITFALPKSVNFFQREPEIIAIREETLKTFFAESFVRTDAPFLVKYDEVAFTFVVEHQHDPRKFSIHHLARYVSYLEEQHKYDVIPIVFFPNASAKNKSVDRETKSAFMGKRYHYFTYEAVFLPDLPAKKFLKSNNIIARLLLPFMHYSKADWIEVLDSSVKAVLELVDPTQGLRQGKYLDFLFYYFNLGKEEWEVYYAHKQKKNEVKEVDMISTLLKEQGRTEGFLKGKTEGFLEGKKEGFLEGEAKGKIKGKIEISRDLLLLLLPKRLGPMPPEIESSVRSLTDLDRIHSILARFMEINDWHELEQLLDGKK